MPQRTVVHGDALVWLETAELGPEHAIVTSLPDISEIPTLGLEGWEQWFSDTVALCCRRVDDHSVAIFYQTDIKHGGTWIDKAYLVQRGAREAGHACLWHKIVCRTAPGNTTFGRPAYGHLLCFSKRLRIPSGQSSPDVLPGLGSMTWARAIPSAAAVEVCAFLRRMGTIRVVVDPFCGHGTMLAHANAQGFDAIGVELVAKRVAKARRLEVTAAGEPRAATGLNSRRNARP